MAGGKGRRALTQREVKFRLDPEVHDRLTETAIGLGFPSVNAMALHAVLAYGKTGDGAVITHLASLKFGLDEMADRVATFGDEGLSGQLAGLQEQWRKTQAKITRSLRGSDASHR